MTATVYKEMGQDPDISTPNKQHRRDGKSDLLKRLYKRHLRGALVRSGASVVMWLFALGPFLTGFIPIKSFAGISLSVLYLILINPPTLWIAERITSLRIYKCFSFLINQLEIIGYTAIIYFTGGINSAYLAMLYCALITYVGVVAPRATPFIITELCAMTFGIMVALEHFGFIPHQSVFLDLQLPWPSQLIIFLVIFGLLHVVAFISSYTARLLKKRKEEVRKKNIELEERSQSLRQTQAQLVQSGKLASIGELAAGVAHELNQPLMVIRANAQLIQRNLRKNRLNREDLGGQLEAVASNTKRMMNIINHLRIFSRQSNSGFIPVDINATLEDSFMMLGEQLRLRNIEVKKDLSPTVPKARGDANQLEQVFLNLMANAKDAIEMSNGGRGAKDDPGQDESKYRGRIDVITRKGKLTHQESTINHRQPRDCIEILIRDNGIGIRADKIDKIFDPFFTSKEVGKGTGLGLSISYGIITDHQGDIEMAETGPNGTTFRIRLPVDDLISGIDN